MRYLACAATVLVLALAGACSPTGNDAGGNAAANSSATQDTGAIDKLRAAYTSAWNAGNAAEIADLYTEDAVALPGNQPTADGRDAILKYNQDFFAQFTPGKMELTPEETKIMGDWAFDRGTYHMMATPTSGGDAVEAQGRYLVILQRQADGSWKVARDTDNTASPPTPQSQ